MAVAKGSPVDELTLSWEDAIINVFSEENTYLLWVDAILKSV